MKLSTQITSFVILILVLTIGSITFFSYYQMKSIFNNQLEDKLADVAYYISEDRMVQEALISNINNDDSDNLYSDLNERIENMRIKSEVDFITIFNMDRIRLTHPNEENIGQEFKGGDELRVLTESESYISKATGTLGVSLRAFEPIFYDGQQVGAVSVGSTFIEINQETKNRLQQFYPVIAAGVSLGIIGAFILAYIIKDDMLGLEPQEIALLFKENEAILDNVKEGIITLNANHNIIQYNKEAERILGLTKEELENSKLIILEQCKNYETMNNGDDINEFEVKIKPGVIILCKCNLIKDSKGNILEQIINFRDLSEVKKMADELTGIKKITWSLRAQNHEFMNKLHTILGLIELGEYDEVSKYISKTVKSRDDITEIITKNIKNKSIAALILEKYYKSEELRINLIVDKQSGLNRIPNVISDDELNSIIGNLIENSFDVVNIDGTGNVYLKIIEKSDKLILEIKDNGPGISDEIRDKIYEPRFTTKEGQRGYGLYIIKKIIDGCGGEILLTVDNGTLWHVEIPYNREERL